MVTIEKIRQDLWLDKIGQSLEGFTPNNEYVYIEESQGYLRAGIANSPDEFWHFDNYANRFNLYSERTKTFYNVMALEEIKKSLELVIKFEL